MLNNFSGVGRLAADPVIRQTTLNKEFAKFTVEIERPIGSDGKHGHDRINCSAWGKILEKVKYIESGDLVAFSGALNTANYKKGDIWVNDWSVNVFSIDIISRAFEKDQRPPEVIDQAFDVPVDTTGELPFAGGLYM